MEQNTIAIDSVKPELSSLQPSSRAADSGVLSPDSSSHPSDLAAIVDQWPALPQVLRDQIIALVTSAGVGAAARP